MMARSSKAPSIGRIQKRKTNFSKSSLFGLQRAAGPYRRANFGLTCNERRLAGDAVVDACLCLKLASFCKYIDQLSVGHCSVCESYGRGERLWLVRCFDSGRLRPRRLKSVGRRRGGIDDLDATVDAIFRMIRIEQLGFPIALGGQAIGRNAVLGDHVIAHGFGAAFRELLIEFVAADGVSVTGDDETERGQFRIA